MAQTIGSVMTSDVLTIHESQTVQEAASLMKQHQIGALPVVNDRDEVVGMITDRDITLRTTAEGDSVHTPISEVMSSHHVIQATPDMDVLQAAQLMSEYQVRRLPVVENGRVVGMVSLGDLAVDDQHDHKAGEALSKISTPSHPV